MNSIKDRRTLDATNKEDSVCEESNRRLSVSLRSHIGFRPLIPSSKGSRGLAIAVTVDRHLFAIYEVKGRRHDLQFRSESRRPFIKVGNGVQ